RPRSCSAGCGSPTVARWLASGSGTRGRRMTERAGRSRVLLAERPRRVLVVVGPSTGGIGAHAAALAADLAALGEQVVVVCPELTAGGCAGRVPVETAGPAGSLAERARAWRRLRALARTAAVVHAHGHQGGLLARAAGRGARR